MGVGRDRLKHYWKGHRRLATLCVQYELSLWRALRAGRGEAAGSVRPRRFAPWKEAKQEALASLRAFHSLMLQAKRESNF